MRTKLALTVVGIAGAVVVASSGLAVAAYSGVASDGQILACWKSSQSANLRLVDHFPCKPGETRLAWNQKGVKGDAGAAGAAGSVGEAGPAGAAGGPGATGDTGAAGAPGATGATGAAGPQGLPGAPGTPGTPGTPGAPGEPGPAGPIGLSEAAQFYALMPPDNAATVPVGGDVDFPQNGPSTDSGATRVGQDTFSLPVAGIYRVSYQVSVNEPGQLVLTLDGIELAHTVAGRATGTSQITATVLVETTSISQVLTVRNPAGNSTAMTITPLAGGTRPVAATLLIERIA